MSSHIADDAIGLIGIRRHEQGEIIEVLEQPEIIQTLMGLPVFPHIQAHMRTHQLQLGLIDIVQTLLVIGLAHAKDPKGTEKYDKPLPAGGACQGCRMVFLDA